MHIHYIFYISRQRNELADKGRRVRTNSALENVPKRKYQDFASNKQIHIVSTYFHRTSFSPQTFELLVSEQVLELFWSASLNRFSSTYFPKYKAMRIRERSISVVTTQHSILRKRRKEGKGCEEVGFVRRSIFKRFWINLSETVSTRFDVAPLALSRALLR